MKKVSLLLFGNAADVVEGLVQEGYNVVTAALEEMNLAALKAIRQQAPELQAAVICGLPAEKAQFAREVVKAHGQIPRTIVVDGEEALADRVRAILKAVFE